MEITGKIIEIFNEEVISDKFKKRSFVIEEKDTMYPQTIIFELKQNKCSLIDTFDLGDTVKVFFNVKGRVHTPPTGEKKYYNTLDAWKLETV